MNKLLFNGFLATTLSFSVMPAQSEIPGSSPCVHFESTLSVGAGHTVNMHNVPVKDVNGDTTYYDLSFGFTFSPENGVSFETISSPIISPPVISATSLVAGRYKDTKGYCYELAGPTFFSETRSLYHFKVVVDTNNGCPIPRNHGYNLTAQLISGTAVGHPIIGHRAIVEHLQNTYIYGIIADAQNSNYPSIDKNWKSNEIIGLMRSSNGLIIARFTDDKDSKGNWKDSKFPVKMVILESFALASE